MGKNERLIEKSKQLEAQLESVDSQIQKIEDNLPTEERNWVDTFLELTETMDKFLYIWNYGTAEDVNILIKKFVNHVIYTKGEELNIVYTKEVQELLSF